MPRYRGILIYEVNALKSTARKKKVYPTAPANRPRTLPQLFAFQRLAVALRTPARQPGPGRRHVNIAASQCVPILVARGDNLSGGSMMNCGGFYFCLRISCRTCRSRRICSSPVMSNASRSMSSFSESSGVMAPSRHPSTIASR